MHPIQNSFLPLKLYLLTDFQKWKNSVTLNFYYSIISPVTAKSLFKNIFCEKSLFDNPFQKFLQHMLQQV